MPFVIALLVLATGASGYVLWSERACERPGVTGNAGPLPRMLALM